MFDVKNKFLKLTITNDKTIKHKYVFCIHNSTHPLIEITELSDVYFDEYAIDLNNCQFRVKFGLDLSLCLVPTFDVAIETAQEYIDQLIKDLM